jgi:Tfp pilus assembly protein PilF
LWERCRAAAARAPGGTSRQSGVFYRKGDYRAATNYVKTAVTKEPTPRRQFHLAMCYSKSGDQNLAAKMLAAALQQDPNLPKTESGW